MMTDDTQLFIPFNQINAHMKQTLIICFTFLQIFDYVFEKKKIK